MAINLESIKKVKLVIFRAFIASLKKSEEFWEASQCESVYICHYGSKDLRQWQKHMQPKIKFQQMGKT